MGLTCSLSKCEVVPSAGDASAVLPEWFPGWAWKPHGGIKLLGAPLGDAEFCASLTEDRVEKAGELLEAIGELPHAQSALLLLRHCASWSKLVYNARTVPPALHSGPLAKYGSAMRVTLERIAGDTLPDRSWALAQASVVQGGIGLRDPLVHAPAAYLASLHFTQELCCRIDHQFDPTDAEGGSGLAATDAEFRAAILDGAAAGLPARKSQKHLSALLDAASVDRLLRENQQDVAFLAHASLCRLPGAGTWLSAPPADDGRELDTPLFRVTLKRRVRAPVLEADCFCPCCGLVMDRWGDHAEVCACGGDRTTRHNALRNAVYSDAAEGGCRPEREKAGLLPPRPNVDGFEDTLDGHGRRPADVWLPRGPDGTGVALDFAATSGMQAGLFREASRSPELVFERYERFKRQHLDTDIVCRSAGFRFVPMIIEAHGGGWSQSARRTLDWIAGQAAAASGESRNEVTLRFAQRISCSLHREVARAVLKRLASPPPLAQSSGWAAGVDAWQ
jgi:hypothetical protein